jgi:hypothetical protein
MVVAFIMGIGGLFLVFTPPPLFDAGVLLFLLSLSLLSFQFSWAHSSLIYVTKKVADKSFKKKLFTVMGVVFVVFASLVIYWLIYKK